MKKIIVATDFNELATAALRFAAVIARPADAEIIVVYADTFEPPPEFTSAQLDSVAHSIERSRKLAKEELDRFAASHIPAGVRWRTVIAEGTPASAIARVAQQEGADLIAMGTHGRGALRRLVLGSVAERIIREATLPVLTVRTIDPPDKIRRVVCPADGSQASVYGQTLATAIGAELRCDGDTEYDLIIAYGDAAARVRRHATTPVITIARQSLDVAAAETTQSIVIAE